MADEVTVTVVNAPAVRAMFAAVAHDVDNLGDPLAKALTTVVVPAASSAAPHATGRLAASHQVGRGTGAAGARITNTATYSGYVHNGTRYLPARPWITQTLDRVAWVDAVANTLQDQIDREAART